MNFQRIMKFEKYIGPSILVVVGSYMLHLSWFKWPDILIDYGRELYIPWQITQGKVLYADINHLYGPFAHYLNALLFQLFGVGLSTLAYFNIVLVILLSCLIYDLFRSAFGYFVATSAVVCFLVVFAFSQYVGIANYNFVCPYSHELTYSIFLSFLTLFIFKRYAAKQEWSYAAIIGFLMGCIFIAKVEVFLAAFISILAGFIIIFWQLRPVHLYKHLICLILCFTLPMLAFFIYFSFHMPIADAFYAIITSYTSIFMGEFVNNIFFSQITGFDNPQKNLMLIFKQIYGYLILLITTVVISYIFARLTNKIFRYVWIGVTSALVFGVMFRGFLGINWFDIARPFPIILLFLLAYFMINLLQKCEDKTFVANYLHVAVLVLFSLLLLLKMILNVHFYHYGFALAMPASLIMIAIFLHYVPMWLARLGSKAVAAAFLGLFVLLATFFYFNVTRQVYTHKNYAVAEGKDQFFTYDDRVAINGPVINITLQKIEKLMSKSDTFVALPEGVMLNYLSRRSNPSRFFEFMPNFIMGVGEIRIMGSISQAKPSFVLLIERDFSEYGARYFGKDYAFNLSAWIMNNYEKKIQIGAEPMTGKGFGIIIAKRIIFK